MDITSVQCPACRNGQTWGMNVEAGACSLCLGTGQIAVREPRVCRHGERGWCRWCAECGDWQRS